MNPPHAADSESALRGGVAGRYDSAAVREALRAPRHAACGVLLETEGLAVLGAAGIAVPRHVTFAASRDALALPDPPFPGAKAVLKAVSPRLLHKTEAGAVRVVPNRRANVIAAAADMERRLADQGLEGFLWCEYVPHTPGPGGEFLLGLRMSRDFGPIVTLGAGGIHAEFLAGALKEGEGLAVFSPSAPDAAAAGTAALTGPPAPAAADPARDPALLEALARLAAARLAIEPQRGRPAALDPARLAGAVASFLALARDACPGPLAEFEVNPLVVSEGRLVALDALGKLSGPAPAVAPPRPIAKIARLLEPRSIAIAGVSEKTNPGRIILQNVLREGFDPAAITVIKPGTGAIDGCRCVPSLGELPAPVDLLVLSVAAAPAAGMLAEAIERGLAESVVLIPGGLDEKPEAAPIVARLRESLAASRRRDDRGPVVNGGNCLGVRSVPGRINTLFIPPHKLPMPSGAPDPVALVTGSGAFAVSKTSKLASLHPVFTITIGNQTDLTIADYLEHLADDRRIEVFAVYLEGFRPLDGARFLEACRRIRARGAAVVLYLAGRTGAGAAAAASHTASVAGDHAVAKALATGAGVTVADSIEDFEDLVRLFARLRGRGFGGNRLGAVSNAGYECVAIADSLGPFTLADWAPATAARLAATLERARLAEIVAVRNPIDLTPILGDAGYDEVTRAVLEDPGVDLGIVGVVPMTGALNSLAAGPGHGDDVRRDDSVARRLVKLWSETRKPWVAVVDAGVLYDEAAAVLDEGGVPTFRAADRALRLLARVYAAGSG
jgi:acyl-CoA synthetase (NDP forming)